MGRVASFGSVNVDRVAQVDAATLASLDDRYDWFPRPGETRRVDSVPEAVDDHVTETLPGGKGANQAVAAARAGAVSRLFGMVGEDGGEVLSSLDERGVDTSAVETADARTGTAYVFVAPDGENHIAIVGGANDAVDEAYARDRADAVAAADVLLVQNEVPAAATVALLDALPEGSARPTVVLDPAPAPGVAPLLDHPRVDVVTPNEREAAALTDPLAAFDGVVVRTRGADPVVVETPGGLFEVAPPDASPVDTTGAGDVFAGYLATELAERDGFVDCGGAEPGGDATADLRTAVEVATTAAALSVERAGVQRATPDRAAVEERR